jgi:glutathione synthase/RimK-type ligase-like ATP-grasp enzyme
VPLHASEEKTVVLVTSNATQRQKQRCKTRGATKLEGVETVKKIGVLFGQENTFPGALVAKINSMEIDGISAEFVEVGGVEMAKPCPYAVIVDRISHDVPFYRSYLKNAALTGTVVINNPFWWSADDKFFNYALAEKLGVAVPRTVLLPSKMYPPMTNTASFRNLEFPLKWDEIFEYVGFPAFLKPHDGGGWRDVFHVHSPQDFFQAYDQTRDLVMTLQAAVNFNEYFRCYVVGREKVHVMAYDPRRPHAERYVQNPPEYAPGLLERVEKDALTLCRALGYDLNTVEFAVEDGVPYAIDFMNPAPDADVFSVGQGNFDWIVNAVAEFAVKKAQDNTHAPMQGLTWSGFLQGGSEMAGVSKGVKAKVKAEVKKVAAKKSTGAAKKAMERDEPLQVKMHAEDLKSQNAAALRAGVNKKMLPARKNP